MRQISVRLIMATLALWSVQAKAELNKENLYIGGTWGQNSVFAGTRFRENVDGDQTWSLYLGLKGNSNWSTELNYEKDSFESTDFESEFLSIGAAYRTSRKEFVTPVLRASLGLNQNKIENGSDKSGIGAKLGGGLEFHFPVVTFTALADWRYLDKVSSSMENSQALVATIGLIWPPIHSSLGDSGKVSATQKTKPIMAIADADKDGVPDSQDKCANTAVGILVNSLGCSETETAVFQIKVEFEPGKTVLQEKYLNEVEELSKLMKSNPGTVVEIAGHTDNTGSEKLNTALSGKRAQAVAQVLTEKFGIESSRVQSKGYGPTQPIADNSTSEGKKANRRVEAKISVKKEIKK